MGSLQNQIPNSQPVPTNIQEEWNIYENEINLVGYFNVLWKHKYFILLGSVLPALLVGLILFLLPRNYTVTYMYDVQDKGVYDVSDKSVYDVSDKSVYDVRDKSVYELRGRSYDVSNWNLDEKNYNVLLDRFYSEDNLNKIVTKLRQNGLDRYAELISGAGEELKKFLDFEVFPPYTHLSKAEITDPAKLEQIRQLKALLLNMIIVARPKKDIPGIASVVRNNLENVIPVYLVQEQLSAATREHRAGMANIEENRFNLDIVLKTNKSVLEKLKNIKAGISNERTGNVALQFDVGSKSEYLPLGYQVQATETRIVEIEENVRANEEKYNHYKDLLALNERLFVELKNKTSFYYTIQQFHLFLTDLVDDYKSKELQDYLNSYIKKIENRMSVSAPVTENPKVCAVPKGTVKKSGIVLAISLMLSVFVAFLLEGLKKSQARTS